MPFAGVHLRGGGLLGCFLLYVIGLQGLFRFYALYIPLSRDWTKCIVGVCARVCVGFHVNECACICVVMGGGLGAASSHWSGKSAWDGRDVDNAVENKLQFFRRFFRAMLPLVLHGSNIWLLFSFKNILIDDIVQFYGERLRSIIIHAYALVLRIFLAAPRHPIWHTIICLHLVFSLRQNWGYLLEIFF